jgi:dUTP pyrophosphatase
LNKINIRVINKSAWPLPAYATEGSSGLDLRANIESAFELQPLERNLVPTGLYFEIPKGYEAQVRPRSGLAIKQGITCLNTPGTIDSDYRGEIKVILINLDKAPQLIHPGDRIAQIVFQEVVLIDWTSVEILETSMRAEGGFGHSGKK